MKSSNKSENTSTKFRPELPSFGGFAILATAYRDASDAIKPYLGSGEIKPGDYVGMMIIPFVFLCFRSIELSLKAVLVHNGLPEKAITGKLGHNLNELLNQAGESDIYPRLDIDTDAEIMLRKYSDKYSNKWFEYSDDFWSEPDIELLHLTCRKACEGIRQYVRRQLVGGVRSECGGAYPK